MSDKMLMRNKLISVASIILLLTACSGAAEITSEETADANTDSANTPAAVASLFSAFTGSADTQSLMARFTVNSTGADLCDADNMANAPSGVFMSAFGGTSEHPIGSTTDSMTINDTDYYCDDNDGDENTGTGPDGDGRFATFVFLGEPQGDCSDGTVFQFTRGSGIARNTEEYYPEIFGRFELDTGDVLDCTLRLLEGGEVDLDNSSCTDEYNHAVSLNTTTSCTISAELPAIADPAYVKGHWGLGEAADDNLNYDCVTSSTDIGDDYI